MLYRITVLTLYLLLSVVSHAVAKDSALETENKKYDTAFKLYSEKEQHETKNSDTPSSKIEIIEKR